MPASSSLWTDADRPARTRRSLTLPESSDVVVIGAGINGLVTAAMLSDHGLDVTVIDGRRSSDSVTARSSAKVSILHELTAARIASQRGEAVASEYIRANQFGFDWIERTVRQRSIDCSWERRDAVTYITVESSLSTLRREVELYREAQVPAEAISRIGLPYAVRAAVRVPDQAQFDPVAFLAGVTSALVDDGQRIVEGVRASAVERRRHGVEVRTDAGTIVADHVVVTTGLPFLDRAAFFARTEPQSSYVLACEVEATLEPAMFLSADGSKRSLRTARTVDGTDVVLVGGEGHKTGQGGNTEQRYANLAAWTNAHFGLRNITHRFMAQDYMTPDHVPFAGPLTPGNARIHVATGMNKWGFTNSAAAAAVNVAKIVDGAAPSWTAAFGSSRVPASGVADLVKTNGNVAAHLIGGWVAAVRRRGEPAPGQGHVTINGSKAVAVSSNRCDATITSVDGVCPHLGAALTWNPAEETWDCPLHGSRFEADGRLLHGPATRDLVATDDLS